MQKWTFILILFVYSQGISQTNFTRADENILVQKEFSTQYALSFADINGDGWDDIVRTDRNGNLDVRFYLAQQKRFSLHKAFNTMPTAALNLVSGDVDNDGVNEIIHSGLYNGVEVLSMDLSNRSFASQRPDFKEFLAQGSNLVDINSDGFLDLFVCNDDQVNVIFMNDGAGNFQKQDLIDFTTPVPSDNSGNYGSEWCDIDGDGDLDLYIAKCRAGVDSADDPRRINVLYLQQDDGQFVEAASDFGIDFGDQSWTGNFGDLDNDGDFDLLVTNHHSHHYILENIENDTFIHREAPIADQLVDGAIQSRMSDMDNNGYLDIVIAGSDNYILYNRGDFNFEKVSNFGLGLDIINSFALADFDKNGSMDAYLAQGLDLGNGEPFRDFLLMNETSKNYIGIELVGTQSNRSAIGAKVWIHGPFGKQVRQLKAGEGYGVTHSRNVHFGLGDYTQVDTIKVEWPSGLVEFFYDGFSDFETNSYNRIVEGTCISNPVDVNSASYYLCETGQQELQLSIEEDTGLWTWTDGHVGISNTVAQSDVIYAYDSSSCVVTSPTIEILSTPSQPKLEYLRKQVCEGTDIEVSIGNILDYKNVQWFNGEVGSTLTISESPDSPVFAQVDIGCGEPITSDAVELSFHQTADPIVYHDTIRRGEIAQLMASGDSLFWYDSETADDPIFQGSTWEITGVENDSTLWVENQKTYAPDTFEIGASLHPEADYSASWLAGEMNFKVLDDCVFESCKVYTDSIGVREVIISNQDNDTIFQKSFDLVVGENILDFNQWLPVGDYRIFTNADVNVQNLGDRSPRLLRNDMDVEYPYEISNLMSITGSSFSQQYYLYFFDWVVTNTPLVCSSDRVPIHIVVDITDSTSDPFFYDLKIFPNPTQASVFISSEEKISSYQLVNVQGRLMKHGEFTNGEKEFDISLENLSSGIYILRIIDYDHQIASFKLEKY